MKRSMALGVVVWMFGAVAGWAAQPYPVVIEHNVPVRMRDGVTLRADIYRPDAPGKFPVLLERTPYNKANEIETGYLAARRGYVTVIEDCRGRYASEGEWYPFKHESQDGYDTVEWAASLPSSNGKVGMFGGSYVGATQMLTAIAHPPHLAGIFPVVTASNYHENWTYQGGAFTQWFDESWTSGLAQDTLNRQVARSTDAMAAIRALPLENYSLFPAPPTLGNAGLQKLAPYFLDWLHHPNYDDYWKQWSIEADYSRIRVPAFHVGGWYDGLLKGEANGLAQEKPVKYFAMGVNEWREADVWPPPGERPTRFYLHSAGKANSVLGDGTLITNPPHGETPDRFVYDPSDPVPTIGGRLCCDSLHLEPGARDQRPNEARQDVLVYSTPVLTHNLDVTGPVHLELYASSTAVDTDFTAKVIDVSPDGFARNVTGGILRARYRNSAETPEYMTPGEVYKFTIDLWATSNVFLKGHRLRLEVSSSNFPRFDRNLNTGESPETGSRWVKATQTIYHDSAHPSALVLPVMAH